MFVAMAEVQVALNLQTTISFIVGWFLSRSSSTIFFEVDDGIICSIYPVDVEYIT
jgi:hypothetical protein